MKKKHFYIEISVVLIVLGLLLLVSIPRFLDAQNLAQVTLAKRGLDKIEKAFELYKTEKGSYPQPMGLMTDPNVFECLLNDDYITKEDIKDPCLGPGELTNDGYPSSFFFVHPQYPMRDKFQLYNTTTSKYRGNLPGAFQYHIGSCGPDKVINLDNPPIKFFRSSNRNTVSPRMIRNIFEVFIDYDPSNGLFSDGDIHLLGPE
jgi:type II secretory pathway pseudopilin PulG